MTHEVTHHHIRIKPNSWQNPYHWVDTHLDNVEVLFIGKQVNVEYFPQMGRLVWWFSTHPLGAQ